MPIYTQGMIHRSLRNFLRFWIVAIPVVTAIWVLLAWRYGPGTGLALRFYANGHATGCSLSEALAGAKTGENQYTQVQKVSSEAHETETDGEFRRWETPLGPFWVPAGSKGDVVYDLAEQGRDIYATSDSRVRPGDIVLDCGANVGVFTRKALNAGASKVIAIEPAPENIACLRRNFATEIQAGSVVIVPKGVWDRETELVMHVDTNHSAADSFVRPLDGAAVHDVHLPVTTIDSLVRELSLPKVDFIKMDIEGSERNAIAGGKSTISKFRPRMAICVYHLPDDPVVVPKGIADARGDYQVARSCLLEKDRVEPQVMHFF